MMAPGLHRLVVTLLALSLLLSQVDGAERHSSGAYQYRREDTVSRHFPRQTSRCWVRPLVHWRRSSSSSRRGLLLASAAPGVTVIYSDRFLEHRKGGFHPEQPTRVSTAARLLQTVEHVSLVTPTAESDVGAFEKALAAVKSVHDHAYVEKIRRLSESGGGGIDSDTYANAKTFEVCILAACAWLDAVETTLATGHPSLALTRPPGHHALANQAMGFCIFNFAVVAARYALDVLGLSRVAILDWDVHHGNGIADLVKDEPRIRYCSLHQDGSFPLTGAADDRGPLGNLLHIPLPAYTDMRTYGPIFQTRCLPFLHDFKPDLVIVSAGYDTLTEDSLAELCMNPADYTTLSTWLLDAFGPSRLVFGLEGGYEPGDTAQAILATLQPFLPHKN